MLGIQRNDKYFISLTFRFGSIELFLKRRQEGMYTLLLPELKKNPERFQNYFRMEMKTFGKLLLMVEKEMPVRTNKYNRQKLICTEERLMLTLRCEHAI